DFADTGQLGAAPPGRIGVIKKADTVIVFTHIDRDIRHFIFQMLGIFTKIQQAIFAVVIIGKKFFTILVNHIHQAGVVTVVVGIMAEKIIRQQQVSFVALGNQQPEYFGAGFGQF